MIMLYLQYRNKTYFSNYFQIVRNQKTPFMNYILEFFIALTLSSSITILYFLMCGISFIYKNFLYFFSLLLFTCMFYLVLTGIKLMFESIFNDLSKALLITTILICIFMFAFLWRGKIDFSNDILAIKKLHEHSISLLIMFFINQIIYLISKWIKYQYV